MILDYFKTGPRIPVFFHEALNVAALWKLPIVYICVKTTLWDVEKRVGPRCCGPRSGIRDSGAIVVGMDVLAVMDAVKRGCRAGARAGRSTPD